MEWTCDKCGKTLFISEEQLSETKGVIVCPQCLSSDTVPGYGRKSANSRQSIKSESQTAAPPPHRSKPQTSMKTSPPPYRKKINFMEESSSTKPQVKQNSTSATRKKNKKKKSKKQGLLAPHSAGGCIWRSFLITLLLMIMITALGFFLDYI